MKGLFLIRILALAALGKSLPITFPNDLVGLHAKLDLLILFMKIPADFFNQFAGFYSSNADDSILSLDGIPAETILKGATFGARNEGMTVHQCSRYKLDSTYLGNTANGTENFEMHRSTGCQLYSGPVSCRSRFMCELSNWHNFSGWRYKVHCMRQWLLCSNGP